ncbi:hypothetical protein ACFVZJ_16550 [Streptomyces sp. NPDC058322]|uniref:hypothetical protein n=1 Tax=Streptomyces sp. NPDC058322 TaxID=3346446 RepID=UPI0036E98FF6
MRYLHSIETTEAADFPAWQAVALADEPEEHDGTAADYGRDVLAAWIYDTDAAGITDEDGRPLLRVRVAFADDPDAFASNSDSDVAAAVECDQLAPPAPEMSALEAARERKLYLRLLGLLADQELADALRAARAVGAHSANQLADYVYPAVSRPIALRMMR